MKTNRMAVNFEIKKAAREIDLDKNINLDEAVIQWRIEQIHKKIDKVLDLTKQRKTAIKKKSNTCKVKNFYKGFTNFCDRYCKGQCGNGCKGGD